METNKSYCIAAPQTFIIASDDKITWQLGIPKYTTLTKVGLCGGIMR